MLQADLTRPEDAALWKDEQIDTVLCSGVLEHLGPDEEVLRRFARRAGAGRPLPRRRAGGNVALQRPGPSQGHQRRYAAGELREKMERAGFEVVFSRSVGKLRSLGWWLWGRVLRRRRVSPRQIVWADRLFPLTRLLDYCLPVAGATLIMVGRRREKS